MNSKNNFGVFIIDKPVGITSFKVISKLRKVCNIRKMGHTGTLDPLASGVLQICVGKATKTIKFLENQKKSYQAKIIFGKKTDTGDSEGTIISQQNFDINLIKKKVSELENFALSITEQVPPKYSAIKIDGVRAYQKARKGDDFKMKTREVKILDFNIINFSDTFLEYSATVSKGTYIRTLSEQIAEFCGTIGYTSELKRIAIEETKIEEATPLDNITRENWTTHFKQVSQILPNFSKVKITTDDLKMIKNGVKIKSKNSQNGKVILIDDEENEIAICDSIEGLLKPIAVFI